VSGRYENDQRSFDMRKIRNATRTTKMVVAAVAALIVFASTYGFAASLGLSSSGLGAGSSVVAACSGGSTIQVAYSTAYASGIPGYAVSQVNLSSIPAACQSKSYKIQLTGAGGATVGAEMSGTLPALATANIATSGNPDASLVTGVSVVIS
jgi:hypothetical protein